MPLITLLRKQNWTDEEIKQVLEDKQLEEEYGITSGAIVQ